MKVPFSYLSRQFANIKPYLAAITRLVRSGDFTLGYPVPAFEKNIRRITGARYCIGVNSGTDALILSLKAAGVGPGDEVITAANTFYATAGAIAAVGARPVFVDVNDSFLMDPALTEKAVTKKTRAIMPVHYMGLPADMRAFLDIAKRNKLIVIEDSCQALGASINGKSVGTFGLAGAFSFHPLKNLNVWGDAGAIVTNNAALAERLCKLRNHGLVHRDEIEFFGVNSRLDSLQAAVGNVLVRHFPEINRRKHVNAERYNAAFARLYPRVRLPRIDRGLVHSYHLYMLYAQRRDELLKFLIARGVEAKIHYPLPLHLQKASRVYGYKRGDFPVCEDQVRHYITLPVHQHLTNREVGFVIDSVAAFYGKGRAGACR